MFYAVNHIDHARLKWNLKQLKTQFKQNLTLIYITEDAGKNK